MKRIIVFSTFTMFFFFANNALATDEVDIQELQTDVVTTKSKADKNAADIESMKGGLPDLERRVTDLEANGTGAQVGPYDSSEVYSVESTSTILPGASVNQAQCYCDYEDKLIGQTFLFDWLNGYEQYPTIIEETVRIEGVGNDNPGYIIKLYQNANATEVTAYVKCTCLDR